MLLNYFGLEVTFHSAPMPLVRTCHVAPRHGNEEIQSLAGQPLPSKSPRKGRHALLMDGQVFPQPGSAGEMFQSSVLTPSSQPFE